MGIIRQFDVSCDKCGAFRDDAMHLATQVRKQCKEEGWTISGNKFTCPVCNKQNSSYWTDLGYHSTDAVIEVS